MWRCDFRVAFLRGAEAHSFGAERVRAPPLSPGGDPSGGVHRLRPEGWPVARGDRRGACEAAGQSCARPCGLGKLVESLVRAHPGAHRRARAPSRGPHRVHRLRLPLAGPVQAGEPPGRRCASWTWSAVLGREPHGGGRRERTAEDLGRRSPNAGDPFPGSSCPRSRTRRWPPAATGRRTTVTTWEHRPEPRTSCITPSRWQQL